MRDEVCIVPSTWWELPFGFEVASNAREPCCSEPASSSYSAHDVLAPLGAQGFRFGWLRAVRTGNAAIDFALSGTGGNALQAALSMCDKVDIFGVGLRSTSSDRSADTDKVYNHYYDPVARDCARHVSARKHDRQASDAHARFYSDRLHTEVLMHVLHALGVVRWVQ